MSRFSSTSTPVYNTDKWLEKSHEGFVLFMVQQNPENKKPRGRGSQIILLLVLKRRTIREWYFIP